jgi:hypothetical protein
MSETGIRALKGNVICEQTSTHQEHLAKLKLADIRISRNVMAKYIRKQSFVSYIVARKPILMVNHKAKCLEWAKDKVG